MRRVVSLPLPHSLHGTQVVLVIPSCTCLASHYQPDPIPVGTKNLDIVPYVHYHPSGDTHLWNISPDISETYQQYLVAFMGPYSLLSSLGSAKLIAKVD